MDEFLDRIRAGNGPKSVQKPSVQKTFVFQAFSLFMVNNPFSYMLTFL